jgi:tetratricopeptide (TPR) repeat protein
LLRRARDQLVAAGDRGNAAKAEMLAAFQFWNEARTEEAEDAFRGALELVENAEPSPVIGRVLSRLAINAMLRGRYDQSMALSDRVLGIAGQLGLEELESHGLNTRGVTRVDCGDLGGLADLEQSIETAERLNAADLMIRGYKNLGSTFQTLGRLTSSTDLQRRGLQAARRFGADFQIAWFDTELGLAAFSAGDWDSAGDAFDRLERWVAEMGVHYMEASARSGRAKLRAARGDDAGAASECASALEFARRSGEPQMLYPILADAALVAATSSGDTARQVAELADELLAARAGHHTARVSEWAVTLALALALTSQTKRFRLEIGDQLSAWGPAAHMLFDSHFEAAADALATIGARPEEALSRILAGRVLIDSGQTVEGEAQLQQAIAFWQPRHAVTYLAMARGMLVKTA